MNAAGYGIEALCVVVLVGMLAAWRWATRQHLAFPPAVYIVSAIVSVTGIVIVPIVARSGSQPGWTAVVDLTLGQAVLVGAQTVGRVMREGRRKI